MDIAASVTQTELTPSGQSVQEPVGRTFRVGIVVTCFNDGDTLPETIASIENCGTPVELIVVDDGSTDTLTQTALSRLEQEGIQVLRQGNQGLAAAASAGVARCSADYVMRFDADDLLAPGAIDELADALDGASDAAAAWGDVQTFGLTRFRIPSVPALDPWLVTHVNCVTGSGVLIRRAALQAVGAWRLSEGFEDWDVWLSLAERGYTGVRIRRVVFRYRRRQSRMLSRWIGSTERHFGVLRDRHAALFAARRSNWRRSPAPVALKLAVPIVELLPLSRLSKMNACEFLARLLWSDRPELAIAMLLDGLRMRARGVWRRNRP